MNRPPPLSAERSNAPIVLMSVLLVLGAGLLIGGGVFAWFMLKQSVKEDAPAAAAPSSSAVEPPAPSKPTWRLQPNATEKEITSGWSKPPLALAAGKAGVVLHMPESGTKWEPETTGTTNDLFGITAAADGSVAFAVGAKGTVLKREGSAWKAVTSGTTKELRGVFSRGSETWAVGQAGTVIHVDAAVDAAAGWQGEKTGLFQGLNAVSGDDARVLAVGAMGVIVEWKDVKSGWKLAKSPTTQDLLAVVVGAGGAWAVGKGGTVLRHVDADAGGSWEVQKVPTKKDLHAIAVDVAEGRAPVIWVVGQGGTILTSSEPGLWVQEESHTTVDLDAVASLDRGLVYAFGAGGTTLLRGH